MQPVEDEQLENIQVVIRVKPPFTENNTLSGAKSTIAPIDEDPTSVVFLGTKNEVFTFDQIKWPDCVQEDLFSSIGRGLSDNCILGYNATIFAYGQTGSGKTFTMQGPYDEYGQLHPTHKGLIPRIFEYLFDRIKEQESQSCGKTKFFCKCSFVEIYNEMIFDLLDPTASNGPCNLREDSEKGVFLEGNVYHTIECEYDAYRLFLDGTKNRTVAETSMNRESSRSHSVFTIYLQSRYSNGENTDIRESRFNLVDLAGSERQSMTATVGIRLKEAGNINKSLMSLGQVINALVDIGNGKQRHVPYRDSKLTFLLRDSLGGNTKTVIIANVNPLPSCAAESLSTLRFAQRAKLIKNSAIVNKDVLVSVTKLRQEIQRLELELENQKTINEALRHSSQPVIRSDKEVEGSEAVPATWNVHFWAEALEQINVLRDENVSLLKRIDLIHERLKRKDEQLYSERMINKFKEQMYTMVDEKLSQLQLDEAVKAKLECLEKELEETKRQYNNHPEVTKFAYENLCLQQDIERTLNISRYAKVEESYMSSLERNLSTVIHQNESLIKQCDELRLLTPEQESSPAFAKENMIDLKKSFEFAIDATQNEIKQLKDLIHAKNEESLHYREEKEAEIHNLTNRLDAALEEARQHREKILHMHDLETKLATISNENAQYVERFEGMRELQEKLQCQSDNLAQLLLKMTFVERERNELRDRLGILQQSSATFTKAMVERVQEFYAKRNIFDHFVAFNSKTFHLIDAKIMQMMKMLTLLSDAQTQNASTVVSLQDEVQLGRFENAKLLHSCDALKQQAESLENSVDNLQKLNLSLSRSCTFAEDRYQSLLQKLALLINPFEEFKSSIRTLWLQMNSMYKEREVEFASLKNCCGLYRSDCQRKLETLQFLTTERLTLSERFAAVNEERLWHMNECQNVRAASNETVRLLDDELAQYKSGWMQMKDEMRTMLMKMQQLKTQCAVTAEDNEQFMREIHGLRKQLDAYESSTSMANIRTLEDTVGSLQKTVQEAEREMEALKEENERLIQHHNMKQKLQYHVKIKQENNELKELLRISKEEAAALRQKIKDATDSQ